MARRRICGFETQGFEQASSTFGTCGVVAGAGRNGGAALRINPTTTAVGYVLLGGLDAFGRPADLAINTVYFRGYLKVATLPAANSEEIADMRSSGVGSAMIQIRIDSAGKLSLYNGTTLIGTSRATLSIGTWYRVECCFVSGTATQTLLIDGGVEVQASNALASSTFGGIRLGKSTNRNGQTIDVYWDDCTFDDAEFPGPGAIVLLLPTGAGDEQDWSGTYAQVDGVPLDTSNPISTSAAGAVSLFTIADARSAGVTGMVVCVESMSVQKEQSAVTSSVSTRLRQGATDSDTSARNNSATVWQTVEKVIASDPETGAPWLIDRVSTTQIGIVNAAAIGSPMLCSLLGVMVEYQPPMDVFGQIVAAVERLHESFTSGLPAAESVTIEPFTSAVGGAERLHEPFVAALPGADGIEALYESMLSALEAVVDAFTAALGGAESVTIAPYVAALASTERVIAAQAVRLYKNTSDGGEVDFSSPFATWTYGGPYVTPALAFPFHHRFVVRRFNGLYEDRNIREYARRLDAAGADLPLKPADPQVFTLRVAGGDIVVNATCKQNAGEWISNTAADRTEPDVWVVRWDNGTGTIISTPIATPALTFDARGEARLEYRVAAALLTDGVDYQFKITTRKSSTSSESPGTILRTVTARTSTVNAPIYEGPPQHL